jgi:hypothetical protein
MSLLPASCLEHHGIMALRLSEHAPAKKLAENDVDVQ